MVLVQVVPMYDADNDVLRLELIKGRIERDVSYSWNISAGYIAGELAEVTLLHARTDSQRILWQALAAVGKSGIAAADGALLITVAVMLRDFEVIPNLNDLPESHRADAGYLVEFVVQTSLTKRLADKVLTAIDRFKPGPPWHGALADSWRASAPLHHRQLAALELVRSTQFVHRITQQHHIEFFTLVAAAGYGTPRSLPKKTETKLRRLVKLVRSKTQAELGFPPEEAERLLVERDARIAKVTARPTYLTRLRAAAEQLNALATAKTDAYRQAQLNTIDWPLVADEFSSVVGRYECSIERYAGQIIRNLSSRTICYQDCVVLQIAMADLKVHLEDFEPGHDFDQDIVAAWEDNYDAFDRGNGLVRHLEPIQTLDQLRHAVAEKLDLHRRLDQGSPAYRSGLSVPHAAEAVAEVLSASNARQLVPPAGYATWLDFAAETMDTRSAELEQLLADGPAEGQVPTREKVRQAVAAELTALRQQALLSACRALRVGQEG